MYILSLTFLFDYPIFSSMESKKLIQNLTSLIRSVIRDFIKLKAKVSFLETKVKQLTEKKKHDRYN